MLISSPAQLMKFLLLFISLCFSPALFAEQAIVAVASNFLSTMQILQQDFEIRTTHKLKVSTGSTGKLFTQIKHGAPFDVFLAANQTEPKKLQQANMTVDKSRSYAQGLLVLAGKPASADSSAKEALTGSGSIVLAIANPKIAPYGFAASEILAAWGLNDSDKIRLVNAENVSQTLSYLISGSANFAFVARSQMLAMESDHVLRSWPLDQDLYTPILQDAVLLKRAVDNSAAKAFYEYLFSEAAQQIIRDSGYQSP